MKELKKKIKFFKYYTLFLQEKLFFVCLLKKHNDYSLLRKQLVLNNFKIKFIKNGFLKNLIYFQNVKTHLTGQTFCVLKRKLDFNDYFILKNILFKNSHVILFYADNKFYSHEKLQFLKAYFQSKISKLHCLSYFYFLVKLGFILKLEKLNKIQHDRVRMT